MPQIMLMRVEAVHAGSWLWVSDVPSVIHGAAEGASRAEKMSTSLTSTLPILRRRARKPRILLASLFR